MFGKRKKYGVKVKRVKTLYKYKKSPLQKAINLTVTVAAVCLLVVIGYSAGKPLIEFFRNGGESSLTEDAVKWRPPAVSENSPVDSVTEQSVTPTTETEKSEQPVPGENIRAIYAPDSALTDENSLAAFLEQAKSQNYNAVVTVLKDDGGYLLYKSELPVFSEPSRAAAAKEIVKGTLTLQQIRNVFDKAGMTPLVKINALSDHAAPKYFDGMNYRFNEAENSYKWMDDRPDRGGKLWIDPFKDASRTYISDITAEIANAGFHAVILSGIVFPPLRPYDASILPKQYSDAANRYNALVDTVNLCASKKGNSKFYIETTAYDVIARVDPARHNLLSDFRTSEVLLGKDKLTGVDGVVVKINLSDCSKLLSGDVYGFKYDASDPNSAINFCQSVSGIVKEQISPLPFIPCIDASGVTKEELDRITQSVPDGKFWLV